MGLRVRISFGVVFATMLVCCGSGTASGDPVPDASRTTTTRDGWELTVSKTGENLTRVPNLATTLLTREGFISADFDAYIAGTGTSPLRAASLIAAFQIGCQVDMSNGVTGGVGANAGVNAGVNGSGTIGQYPSLNGGPSAGFNAGVAPSVSVTVKPGTITTLAVATKAMAGPHASIHIEEINLKVDSCGGLTSIRAIGTLSASTAEYDTQVTAYGPPIWL
ncbi:MspA family porin [Nocardia sp. NPDC059240]|uniref:MspA family porin n=1 Tax=Nocardia sp. NPDC059240 TaxID=3346786 RepID=UPI0036CA5344